MSQCCLSNSGITCIFHTMPTYISYIYCFLETELSTVCPEKKRSKCFFVLSSIKLRLFWTNLVDCFLNKFAAKSYKRFPPRLNNVSTLPCETWNAHRARATIELSEKKLQNLLDLNCGLQIYQIWIQLSTACGECCKKRCTKQASLIWMKWESNWEQSGLMCIIVAAIRQWCRQ